MNITALLASFGGGLFGAAIGGVPSFVFTGLTVIIAILAGDFGAPAINIVSFGPWFVPCVSFGGAVAAAAYAKKKGYIEDGMDIVTPLAGLKKADVLLVGGVFGIIGYLLNLVIGDVIGTNIFGTAGWTDTVALSVLLSGIIVRLVFTSSGITGKPAPGTKRAFFPQGNDLTFSLIVGAGYGLLVAGVVASFGHVAYEGTTTVVNESAAYLFSNMGVFAFGIAAVGLAFACMGLPFLGCHHIVLPAATTAIVMYSATLNPFVAMIGGIVMGMLGSVIGDFMGNMFNSYADSHIDPPACTIWILQLINFLVLPLIFPSILI